MCAICAGIGVPVCASGSLCSVQTIHSLSGVLLFLSAGSGVVFGWIRLQLGMEGMDTAHPGVSSSKQKQVKHAKAR